jgi:hypothetical protein
MVNYSQYYANKIKPYLKINGYEVIIDKMRIIFN